MPLTENKLVLVKQELVGTFVWAWNEIEYSPDSLIVRVLALPVDGAGVPWVTVVFGRVAM